MATQLLVNVFTVTNLAGGASTTLAHGLRSGDAPVTPTQVLCDRSSTLAVSAVTSTTFTVTNLSPTVPASANFRAEYDHSIHASGATPIYWRGYLPPITTVGQAVFIQLSDSTASRNIDAAVPHIVTYDLVEASNGITLVSGINGASEITVPQDGVYEFSISPQFTITGGGSSIVSLWARLDGVDIPRSNSRVQMGNNSQEVFPFISIILPMTTGQRVEWGVHGTGVNTFLTSYPANAIHPSNPAIIASAKLIGS